MTMKVYLSAARFTSPKQIFEVWIWLANISAALFIGDEGDVRVGSGAHREQKVFIQRYNSPNIFSIFALPYDSATRVYLGMDYEGGLETVVASGPDPRAFLTALRLEQNQYQRLETMFTFKNVASQFNCTGECYTFASASTGHTLSIQGNSLHSNITKLHIKAQGQASRLDPMGPCMKNPGPYQQRKCSFAGYPIYVLDDAMLNVRKHQERNFTSRTCTFGRLKLSYPVGVTA